MIRVDLRLSAAGLVALLAAGCADLGWQKEGADALAHDRDLGECRQAARLQSYSEAWPYGLAAQRMIGMDSRGFVIVAYPYRFETDRFLLENDLTRSCMLARGYELAPVKTR